MTVQWNTPNLKNDPAVKRRMLDQGWKVAEYAALLAPKRIPSAGGAASIRAELVKVEGVPEVHVSWDRAHFYMGFAELGTVHQRATPFLRPAAQRFK